MKLKRVAAPSSSPVSIDEAMSHCVLSNYDESFYIEDLIRRAVATIDGANGIGICLEPQTWELAIDCFPSVDILLPLFPVLEVESIKYIDVDGVEQTVDPSVYELDDYSNPSRIFLAYGQSYPVSRLQPNAVKVQFSCGHQSCPEDIKQAILMMVAHWYENREATSVASLNDVPFAIDAILDRYRVAGIA